MIMPKIELEWKAQSNIRTEAVSVARPLLEAISLRAVAVRARIQRTGKSGDGRRFRGYTKRGARTRHKSGLQTGFKDFTRTGTLWRSLRAKLASPTRATLTFSGKAARGTTTSEKTGKILRTSNAAIARRLNRRETSSILLPTQSEIEDLNRYIADRLTSEIVTAQALEETAFQLARRTRAATRRADKAIRQLRGRS